MDTRDLRDRARSWWRRKPVKRGFVLTHRWSALVLGLVLLIVTTSGIPLLYEQEITRARHAAAYEEAGGVRVRWKKGHRPADAVTNVGYVVVSLVLLPLLVGSRVAAAGEVAAPARSDHIVVALACGVVAIVVLRMHATWR